MRIVFVLGIVSGLFLGSCKPQDSGSTAVNQAGKRVYLLNCVVCHGKDGKLGVGGAKDLTAITSSRELRKEIIIKGRGSMTPFEGRLSDEQIEAVLDYIEELGE